MCATLIGGLTRLKREYIDSARSRGVELKVFTGKENRIASRIGGSDLVIVIASKISHEARNQVVRFARSKNIPLRMAHSSGAKSVTSCFGN